MQKVINVDLDVKRATAQPAKVPSLVVGDTGNKIIITMYDNGAALDLSDATLIMAVFSKVSDGTICEQDTDDAAVNLERIGLTVSGTPANNNFINVMWTSSEASTSITCSQGLSASINRDLFKKAYPEYGTYNFHYVTSEVRWLHGDHSVTFSGNVITINPVRTGSYGYGKNNCEIQIYEDDELITSAQFNFDGRPAILNDDTIKSDDHFPILLDLIRRVESAERSAGDMSTEDYDSDADGVVNDADHAAEADDSELLDGHPASYFATATSLATHASQHASGGTDAITPASIGAGVPSTSTLVSLLAANWTADGDGFSQTVGATGVTTTNNIVVSPGASAFDEYNECGIRCTMQYAGQLKFYAKEQPENSLGVCVCVVN